MGNREAQDEIRAAHPKEPHCEKLLQSPWACDGCPNNPFKEGEEACSQEELEEMTPFLKLGLELYISHGARPNPWALKTDLWTLASIVGRFFEAQTNSPILGGSPPKSESDA